MNARIMFARGGENVANVEMLPFPNPISNGQEGKPLMCRTSGQERFKFAANEHKGKLGLDLIVSITIVKVRKYDKIRSFFVVGYYGMTP